MKIYHVIDSGGLYGAEVMLLSLMQQQQSMGIDCVLVSIGSKSVADKPLEIAARDRGFEVLQVRMNAGPNLLGAYRLLKKIHQDGGELIHSHGYKGNILFGFMPYWLRKIPMVTTLHGWTSTTKMRKIAVYEWLDAKSFRFIDQVVLVNEAMLQHPRLKQAGAAFKVVNNGIPLTEEAAASNGNERTPPDRQVLDFCDQGRTVCAVGRLSTEKGFDILLRSFRDIATEYADVRLLILGEGNQRSLLENAILDAGLTDRVLLAGYQPNAAQYFQYCTLLAMPSLTEGLPITALEAMREGLPMVASKVGGLPDVLNAGECGLLVEPGCSQSLTEAMRVLFENEDLRQTIRSRARVRLQERYSAEVMAKEYYRIYAQVLGPAGNVDGPDF